MSHQHGKHMNCTIKLHVAQDARAVLSSIPFCINGASLPYNTHVICLNRCVQINSVEFCSSFLFYLQHNLFLLTYALIGRWGKENERVIF